MEHTERLDADDMLAHPIDPRRGRSGMRALGALALLAVVIAVVAALYLWKERTAPPSATPAAPAVPAPAAPTVAPQPNFGPTVNHPIEAIAPPVTEPAALPAIADSDTAVHEALGALLGTGLVDRLFYSDRMVRRIVATVDNLARPSLSADIRPVKPVPGTFATLGSDASRQIALDNAARYTPYVNAFAALDSRALVASYVRFYPLFQQAYRDLGYPNGYFNDRLVDAIDNLLAAPVIEGPIALTQPKVLYEYADPALQSLSAGQKMMLRMGPENAARVRTKLREIRALVTSKRPG